MNIHLQGLLPLKEDKRDFSHTTVFGAITVLPIQDFTVGTPLKIKDQLYSDMCAAFASSSISELQEGVELSPEWQFSQIKKILNDITGYGSDLRTAIKSICNPGSLEQKDAPYSLANKERDFLANWNNWDVALEKKAAEHAKQSFFSIGGYADTFDSIRATLWQNKNESRAVLTGAWWYQEWTNSPDGIIPKIYSQKIAPHAFYCIGQKNINGELYIIAVLSNGMIGDKGYMYFPREVVNREFTFGNYTVKDLAKETAQYYHENGMSIHDSWVIQLMKILASALRIKVVLLKQLLKLS